MSTTAPEHLETKRTVVYVARVLTYLLYGYLAAVEIILLLGSSCCCSVRTRRRASWSGCTEPSSG